MKYPIPIGCSRPGFLGSQARFGTLFGRQFWKFANENPKNIVCEGNCDDCLWSSWVGCQVKQVLDLNREISCWLDCFVRGDLLQKQWILRNEIALTHDSGLCPLSPAAMISLGATRLPFWQCVLSFMAEDQQRRGFLLFWHPCNLESSYIRWHKGSFFPHKSVQAKDLSD